MGSSFVCFFYFDNKRRRAFELMQMLKSVQRPTGDHGVAVPDVVFKKFVSSAAGDVVAHGGMPWLYDFDVKRFAEHLYSPRAGRGVPMKRQAGSVRSEWTRKAAEADKVWSSVPKGADGPIQRRYRSS